MKIIYEAYRYLYYFTLLLKFGEAFLDPEMRRREMWDDVDGELKTGEVRLSSPQKAARGTRNRHILTSS